MSVQLNGVACGALLTLMSCRYDYEVLDRARQQSGGFSSGISTSRPSGDGNGGQAGGGGAAGGTTASSNGGGGETTVTGANVGGSAWHIGGGTGAGGAALVGGTGASNGGATTTGGAVTTTGGSSPSWSGGVSSLGGTSAGIAGGLSATGGTLAANTGGLSATGGTLATNTGGLSATGGTLAANTGGLSATGGTLAANTGGLSATGGTLTTGTGSSTPSTAACSPNSFGGKTYMVCANKVRFADAAATCAVFSMLLVRIDNNDENLWVANVVADSWIGADDLQVPQEWRWADGTLFWMGDKSGAAVDNLYTAWAPSQPATSPSSSDCGRMDSRNLTWVAVFCTGSNPFVCE